jgi:hypothetical protein
MGIQMFDPEELINETLVKDEGGVKPGYYLIEGLPSSYRLYPAGTEVYGRSLNVREVKRLTELTPNNSAQIINSVIAACTYGYPVEEMLNADKFYIIFWLRANTYKNTGYNVPFECGHCGKQNEYRFDMDAFSTKRLGDEFDIDYSLVLPESQDTIQFKFLLVKDELGLTAFKKNMKKSVMEFDEDILDLCVQIRTINGNEYSLRDKHDYVTKLTAGDYSYLQSYIEHIDIGVVPLVEAVCSNPECKEVTPVELRFHPEFFVPKHKF